MRSKIGIGIGTEILQIPIATAIPVPIPTPGGPEPVDLRNELLDRPTAPSISGGSWTPALDSAPAELHPGKPRVTDPGKQTGRQTLVDRSDPDTMLRQPEATIHRRMRSNPMPWSLQLLG